MIVRERPSIATLFFIRQGSVVPQILGSILAMAGLSLGVVALDRFVADLPHISLQSMGVLGLALSLFLGFRNNAAYARWWEARLLWGQLVSDIRALSREAMVFLPETADQRKLLCLACVFAHSHRGQLRGTSVDEDIQVWLPAELTASSSHAHTPSCDALNQMARLIQRQDSRCSPMGQYALTRRLSSMSNAQAGNERLASTPIPFVYSLLIRRCVYLYCLLLPFALIETAGWFAPLFSAIAAYVFLGLDEVTEELQSPFTSSSNSLPLDALCRTIEISVAKALDLPVPEPLKPVDYCLH